MNADRGGWITALGARKKYDGTAMSPRRWRKFLAVLHGFSVSSKTLAKCARRETRLNANILRAFEVSRDDVPRKRVKCTARSRSRWNALTESRANAR